VFYALLAAAQLPAGEMLTVTVDSSLPVTAYAVAASDGSTTLVLVNKGATKAVVASVTLPAGVTQGSSVELAGTGLAATTGTTLAGSAVSASGAWAAMPAKTFSIDSTEFTIDVPAATALLVTCT
jgi:hypothetical protein